MRVFDTGASRDDDDEKVDFEGFLSPRVLDMFAAYMHKHRKLPDGSLRESDNWQKGIPSDVAMKSLFRHFMDVWRWQDGLATQEEVTEALCGLMFNTQVLMYNYDKEQFPNG